MQLCCQIDSTGPTKIATAAASEISPVIEPSGRAKKAQKEAKKLSPQLPTKADKVPNGTT